MFVDLDWPTTTATIQFKTKKKTIEEMKKIKQNTGRNYLQKNAKMSSNK